MTESRPAVLLVEDEPDVRMVLQRFLRHLLADHGILVVANNEAALTLLEERSVALVFTDYCLLSINGGQLAHQIKAQSPTTHIVLISAAESALKLSRYFTPALASPARAR